MTQTPNANRTTIVLTGRRNAGKSSLLNSLCGQSAALVSPVAGTTTDPVTKASELAPLGPVLYIDTAGYDDEGELGNLRVQKSLETFTKADAFLFVVAANGPHFNELDTEWLNKIKNFDKPIFFVATMTDLTTEPIEIRYNSVIKSDNLKPLYPVSNLTRQGIDTLKKAIADKLTDDEPPLVGHTLPVGSLVMLVMPQDIQAPKGRLILPQVQVLRELLDYNHRALCVTFNNFTESYNLLKEPPALIITDSQLFPQLKPLLPVNQAVTSFSILMAGRKGDINYYTQSLNKLKELAAGDKILILEACSHHALKNDIARQQIPNL
ncbi:MAG: [FeFe] hydrogenase H-cluster maturation GTPase HydF, partial [Spirochaetaceae bacterium]|nr:[FeFe] hydrogenase H-cluster maturation GTPase HydF [Spirochaetaceae bacterium]